MKHRNLAIGLFMGVALLAASACGKDKKATTTPVAVDAKAPPAARDEAPGEVATAATEPARARVSRESLVPIYFEYDSALLSEESRDVLQLVARYLEENPDDVLTIAGHTDDRGTSEYNIALGQARAQAARDYLVRLGVAPERIRVVSFGEEQPAHGGEGEDAWSKNRRDEFDLSVSRK